MTTRFQNGNLYGVNNTALPNIFGGKGLDYIMRNPAVLQRNMNLGHISNLGNPSASMQAQPQQQTMMAQGPDAFQNKLNNLTIKASDALYGGLLGYNPKPITSPTGDQYAPPDPSGGFRFPFGLLSGMGGK